MDRQSKIYYVRRDQTELEVAPTLDARIAELPVHERTALWSMLFDTSRWASDAQPGEQGSLDYRANDSGVGQEFGLYLKDYDGYVWNLLENRSPALSRVELAELYGLASAAENAVSAYA
jgi:hypothetical protein